MRAYRIFSGVRGGLEHSAGALLLPTYTWLVGRLHTGIVGSDSDTSIIALPESYMIAIGMIQNYDYDMRS